MDIAINTAQNININYKPAGVIKRILAIMIDFCLLGIILLSLVIIISMITTDPDAAIFFVLIILSFYHLVCEFFFNGQSVGKSAMQIRVVRIDGKKLTFWDCLLRWMFRLIDISMNIGVAATASILFSARGQRLGDLAAGTTVIVEHKTVSLRKLNRYNTTEDYEIVFRQAGLLSDRDINTIRETMTYVEKNEGHALLPPLTAKIKELTGIQTEMSDLKFINTILRDYTALSKLH